MYRYDEFDAAFVAGRTAQFSDQVKRRLSGELTEDQFRPLRLMNGHFTPNRHFAFEAVAWYWHFVDVVWLGLFIFVYWI